MSDSPEVHPGSGRRRFLQAALSSALVGVAAQTGFEVVASTPLSAQSNMTPDAALEELVAGNGRFAANQLKSIEHDLTVLKERTVDKQEPFAARCSPALILACRSS